MDSKILLAVLVAVILTSGCVSQDTSKGEFELLVSDAPAAIDDFESLKVSFSEARVFRSNNSKETILLSNETVELTELTGAKAESLVNTTLETGNYTKIELEVSQTTGIVNGSNVDVKVPPGKLMITKNFEIAPNKTTQFVFDIQVVLRGNKQNNQGYILKPVISESGVVGKDVEITRDRENKTPSNLSGQRPSGAGRPNNR